jgi:hypothetical protein
MRQNSLSAHGDYRDFRVLEIVSKYAKVFYRARIISLKNINVCGEYVKSILPFSNNVHVICTYICNVQENTGTFRFVSFVTN